MNRLIVTLYSTEFGTRGSKDIVVPGPTDHLTLGDVSEALHKIAILGAREISDVAHGKREETTNG